MLLAKDDVLGIYVHRRTGADPPEARERRSGHRIEVRVKQVCHACNHNWMSRLETEAQPFLTPMILRHSVELTVDAQMVVSRWAEKTAVMFHYAYPALAMPTPAFSTFAVDPRLRTMLVYGSQPRRVPFSPQRTK